MPPELLRRFQELDSLGWGTPPGFNFYEAIGEVLCKRGAIENILGTKLSIDTNAQDASFFTELASIDPRFYDPIKGGAVVQTIAIRFSSFDRMVTVFGTELEKWAPKLPALYEFLEKQKYLVIKSEYLDEPYLRADGNYWGMDGYTWRIRFFDYL